MTSPRRLVGRRVLVTAQRRAAELAAALQRRGASVDHAPMLSVVQHANDHALLTATLDLIEERPDVVVITTGIGLRGWIEAADGAGVADQLLDTLREVRLIVRGPKAHGAAQSVGLVPDWVAESETHGEIRDLLLSEGVAGRRIAIQHHGAGADGLDADFIAAGADVVPLVVYRWGRPEDIDEASAAVRKVADGEYDAVVFTSAPAAREFLSVADRIDVLEEVCEVFGPSGPVLAAAVGTTTAAPLRNVGIVPLVPDRFRLGALVRALLHELDDQRGLRVQTAAGSLHLLRSAAVLDDEVLALSPTGLSLLRRLAEADGAVVGRDELVRVMPGETVSPHALEVAIGRLRETLPGRDLIATVIKRGYRLQVQQRDDT
ncbi:uroporphyrinogen-III synthase [Cumulibacter soli]|uniref:uroporphyrinogen-III synthase n=1 Tax=Cumulibacter soli TaxID=2546344 RepID=UPI001067A7CB|nr:uroporphyrinogen-III synthase [Cumulibacter soli]